ncbi:DUF5753 domain-containing protein [Streptomyces sp. NPDC006274]|uniref:DUF5753 domain-containing protein n=1 Tax=unclassified Streptomyces TaxID=2593676 RepID=UPI0033A2C70E
MPPLPDPEELEERIAARLARQELLAVTRKPPTSFSFIVEQAVLERWTGGECVSREQFDRLLELIERNWNVEFQVMPLRQASHAGTDGPIMLAETPDNRWFAYSEGQQNGHLIANAKEISLLQQRYTKLRSQALPPEGSLGLLKRLRGQVAQAPRRDCAPCQAQSFPATSPGRTPCTAASAAAEAPPAPAPR